MRFTSSGEAAKSITLTVEQMTAAVELAEREHSSVTRWVCPTEQRKVNEVELDVYIGPGEWLQYAVQHDGTAFLLPGRTQAVFRGRRPGESPLGSPPPG